MGMLDSNKRVGDLHGTVEQSVNLSRYTGQAQQLISVQATHDFDVIAIGVVAQGAAQGSDSGSEWIYRPQAAVMTGQTVVIHATASDRPGNPPTKSFEQALI